MKPAWRKSAAQRALDAKAVRTVLLARPDGMTTTEIKAALGWDDLGTSLNYLRHRGFARMSPSNAKVNGLRGELWFAATPPDDDAPETSTASFPGP